MKRQVTWVLYLDGKNDKAFEIAKRVVELNASNQDYLDTLFRILTSSERYDEITPFSNNVSSNANALLLANAHMHLDEQTQAQKALATYVMMEPRLARSMRFVGIQFEQVGPVIDYHGRRAPYYINPSLLYANLRPSFKIMLKNIQHQVEKYPRD